MDDRESILLNPEVQAETIDSVLGSENRSRMLVYASLWLNHQWGGLEPWGYHLVNVIVHLINTVLVYGVFGFVVQAIFP